MIRSPIRPTVIPSARPGTTASAIWKNRNRYVCRLMFTAFAIVAPAIPPRREIPPFQIVNQSSGLANSETWAITYATRAPITAPINAQTTTEFAASTGTPRRTASFVNSHDPVMKPIAIPSPCGEIAKEVSPKRNRSITGQPTAAMIPIIAASLAPAFRATSGAPSARPQPRDGAPEEESGDDVAGVVDAQRHPRRGHAEVERRQPRPARDADPQLPRRDPRERRQDGRVARRPRGAVRLRDHPARPVGVRGERSRPVDEPLQTLERHPRAGRARQGSPAFPPSPDQREDPRGRSDGVERSSLGDRPERRVDRLAPLGVRRLEEVLVELAPVLGPERRMADRGPGPGQRGRPDDPSDPHRSPMMRRNAYRRPVDRAEGVPERAARIG